MKAAWVLSLLVILSLTARAQDYKPSPDLEALHVPLDSLLESYVRDGLVYYGALKKDRARLARYVASLNAPAVAAAYAGWSRDQQKAFWLNAYDALVLLTVVDHYPIRGNSKLYPANSIRQIPGAFERTTHMVAGKSVTLDHIETEVLAAFKDPRVFVALGRGAVGSGRLRSEAFGVKMVDRQLEQAKAQFATTPRWVRIDALTEQVTVSPILSWRSAAFIDEYADDAFELPKRQPIELAVVGFLRPHLLDAEEEFLRKNTFQLAYDTFDWRLNDLTGGRPD